MERKEFLIQTGIVAGAALLAPSIISAKKKAERLVILHTNDTHSNIDPFPPNHPKFPNQGGVSKRANVINQIRREEENVLLLDAGDLFQGTPYFNKFKGVIEMKTMEAMGYDVVTLGNHDFDLGADAYAQAYKEHATFSIVNANYDLSKTSLSSVVSSHTIIKKGRFKIGVFGLGVNLNGLVSPNLIDGIQYIDPIPVAQQQADLLAKKGCNVVICLSHLGYNYPTDQVSDKILAKNTHGIDVIIGGHTHTFLESIDSITNKNGKQVYINQVGYGGLKLGRIDLEISDLKANGNISSSSIALDESIA